MLDLESKRESKPTLWFICLMLSQLTVVTSLNLMWVYIIRSMRFLKYVVAVITQCICYLGFLNSLNIGLDDMAANQMVKTLIGLVVGVISWLIITEITLLKIENDIITTF